MIAMLGQDLETRDSRVLGYFSCVRIGRELFACCDSYQSFLAGRVVVLCIRWGLYWIDSRTRIALYLGCLIIGCQNAVPMTGHHSHLSMHLQQQRRRKQLLSEPCCWKNRDSVPWQLQRENQDIRRLRHCRLETPGRSSRETGMKTSSWVCRWRGRGFVSLLRWRGPTSL